MNTFKIYLLLFFVQVHSRGSTSDVLYILHICCHRYMRFLTVCKVGGDEESQSPFCALYLLWNVTTGTRFVFIYLQFTHVLTHNTCLLTQPQWCLADPMTFRQGEKVKQIALFWCSLKTTLFANKWTSKQLPLLFLCHHRSRLHPQLLLSKYMLITWSFF